MSEGCVLYFEAGTPSNSLYDFLETNKLPGKKIISGGTLWPKPKFYHIPATIENLDILIKLSEKIAEPELAIHFHVYKDDEFILEWFDAFNNPMIVTGKLSEGTISTFAGKLKMDFQKIIGEH